MRILVVGPTTPIGRRVVSRLAEAGHDLVLYARRSDRVEVPDVAAAPSTEAGAPPPEIRVVEGDVADARLLEQAAEGCEVCLHHAAWRGEPFRVAAEDVPGLMRVNVTGTRNVARVCRSVGVRRLVYLSTWLAGTPAAPERLTPYVLSRLLAEAEVWRAGAAGVEALVLAPALMVGLEEGPFADLLVDLGEGRIPAFVEGTDVPVVAADDVVDAHLAALERGVPGTRYLLEGGRLSWRRLGDIVGLETGWPVVLRQLKPRTAELASRFDAAVMAKVMRRSPLVDPERLAALTHAADEDPGAAVQDLGLSYRPAETAVREQAREWVETRRIGAE